MEVVDNATSGLEKCKWFKQKNGAKVEPIGLVFDQLARSRPDYQVVMNFVQSVGFTKPMILGLPSRFARGAR